MNNQGQLSIENGRKFENLLQVVDHYSRTADGLLGSLGDFCPVGKFAALESQVVHGPKRIDENEIIIQGELGEKKLLYNCIIIGICLTESIQVCVHYMQYI